jgi:cytoskeletal protein CcmA (bactofilin family)
MFGLTRRGTVIAEGLKIEGSVTAEGLVEVNGQVEGFAHSLSQSPCHRSYYRRSSGRERES